MLAFVFSCFIPSVFVFVFVFVLFLFVCLFFFSFLYVNPLLVLLIAWINPLCQLRLLEKRLSKQTCFLFLILIIKSDYGVIHKRHCRAQLITAGKVSGRYVLIGKLTKKACVTLCPSEWHVSYPVTKWPVSKCLFFFLFQIKITKRHIFLASLIIALGDGNTS